MVTLNDAQDVARLISMEIHNDEDDTPSSDSDENRDDRHEDMTWNFHNLQWEMHRSVLALQVIR